MQNVRTVYTHHFWVTSVSLLQREGADNFKAVSAGSKALSLEKRRFWSLVVSVDRSVGVAMVRLAGLLRELSGNGEMLREWSGLLKCVCLEEAYLERSREERERARLGVVRAIRISCG